jgi:dolichyl-phosphate-mannose-protein mannosyltransferase
MTTATARPRSSPSSLTSRLWLAFASSPPAPGRLADRPPLHFPDLAETRRRHVWFAGASADTVAMAALTALGGILRAVRLTTPNRLYFDEPFYAKAGCVLVGGHRCGVPSMIREDVIPEHPPLAKWLIGGGVRLFGMTPFGWRVAAFLFGTACIPVLYLLARRLLGSTLGASLASGLLAIDFLHFVHSRVAMLDVFVTFFGILAFLFLVLDRDRLLRPEPRQEGPGSAPRLWRPWRFAAGAAAGAAAACKWEGWFVLAALVVVSLGWEARAGQAESVDGAVSGSIGRVVRAAGPSLLIGLVAVPIAVYVLTFVGDVHGPLLEAPWRRGSWVQSVAARQHYILHYHLSLRAVHPYASPAWSWVLLKRPMAYFFQVGEGGYREVLAAGSPLVWWASVPAVAHTIWRWAGRRDPRCPEGTILAALGATFVPWLLLPGGRVTFLFYLLPAVPFLCLALGLVGSRMVRSPSGRGGVAIFAAASVLLFAFYFPVMTAIPLSYRAWHARMLFTDCDRQGVVARTGFTATGNAPRTPDIRIGVPPPAGWCWI